VRVDGVEHDPRVSSRELVEAFQQGRCFVCPARQAEIAAEEEDRVEGPEFLGDLIQGEQPHVVHASPAAHLDCTG